MLQFTKCSHRWIRFIDEEPGLSTFPATLAGLGLPAGAEAPQRTGKATPS